MKSRQKSNIHDVNGTSASSALIQVSKLFDNYPQNISNVESTNTTTKATECAVQTQKKKHKQKIKPMSDEEFERLLQNLKKPLTTSEGGRKVRKAHNNTPMESLRNKCLYANIPINKIIKNQSHKIDENKLLLNHMYDGLTGKK